MDQDVLKQRVEFGPVHLEKLHVPFKAFNLQQSHAARNAAADRTRLVGDEIYAGGGTQ